MSVTEIRYLLDSNICIYFLKGTPLRLRDRVLLARPHVAVPSISYAEVQLGLARGGLANVEGAAIFFRGLPIMPFDRAAADSYAQLPFRRARFDRLIAAQALALNATLVTNNFADFSDISGLKLENWVE